MAALQPGFPEWDDARAESLSPEAVIDIKVVRTIWGVGRPPTSQYRRNAETVSAMNGDVSDRNWRERSP